MKILFLDVDGVLNSAIGTEDFKDKAKKGIGDKYLIRLARIVKKTDCKIVISSSWRYSRDLMFDLIGRLADFNLHKGVLIGKTPNLKKLRHLEIIEYVNHTKNVEKIAILDDDSDACIPDKPESFFKTEWGSGLTDQIADKVIAFLNKDDIQTKIDSGILHTCPYKGDVYGDYKTLCECDAHDELNCRMDT